MIFRVEKKSGFISEDVPLCIYDERGIIFYRRNKFGEKKFNLPIGTYQTRNKIYLLETPVTYIAPKMQKPEKNFDMRTDLNVNVIENYSEKANINVGEGIINMRAEAFRLPKPVWVKMFFHEIGHHLFYTEKLCDQFADLCMLQMGFNPSQLIIGTLCSLKKTKGNLERVMYNFNNGLRTKQK